MKRLAPALLVIAVVCLGVITSGQAPPTPVPGPYAFGADSEVQPGVPTGTLHRGVLPPGRVYPGVPHNYSVYVPANYDRTRPAPVMIFNDGTQFAGDGTPERRGQRTTTVFDNLIAKKELPPMVGIFVDPGVMPAVDDATQQRRFNRTFEYDNIDGRYARFLSEELIPELAKLHNLNISSDPSDRGIAGISTGAVGAFSAAWNRPDQFRRVLTFIGTFVDMRGANIFPSLIRKTEPKPIRIFMQEGVNDQNGVWGSWPQANQAMEAAFVFSNYDHRAVWGTEGHNMVQGGPLLPDALRWLWRDYPAKITVPPPVTQNFGGRQGAPGAGAQGGAGTPPTPGAAPAAVQAQAPGTPGSAAQGGAPFVDVCAPPPPAPPAAPPAPAQGAAAPQGGQAAGGAAAQGGRQGGRGGGRGGLRPQIFNILCYGKDWEPVQGTFRSAASPASDKAGTVFFADPVANRIYRVAADGATTVFKEGTSGARALKFGADGRLYASQPGRRRIVSYGPGGDEKLVADQVDAHDMALTKAGAIFYSDMARKTVVMIAPGGVKKTVYAGGEIAAPAALALSPDQFMLDVMDARSKYGWSFQVAADGSLVAGQPFFRLQFSEQVDLTGVDGIAIDANGFLYVPTAAGIEMWTQIGRVDQIIGPPVPTATVSHVAFGGAERNWLYATTTDGRVFRRPVKRAGAVVWEPAKPPMPQL